ncbi:hypothetical protein BGX27_009738 [Mortierella sp. AM989]|nr:hypothetical protein BGX27_009738 [Mortierella sp. AM989]
MLPTGCGGYPLGYPSRADANINTKYTYLVEGRRPDAPLCQPGRQNIPGNNPFPVAAVTPGQNLHLTWQPDGHLDDAHPSIVEIHWTGIPGTQLYTRSELSLSTLLSNMTFATSDVCDQPSEPNTWCHGHLDIPKGIQPGTYQMIWWWKYDHNSSGEEYSTCFEVVVNGNGIQPREIPVQYQPQIEASTPEPTAAEITTPQTYELAYMVVDPLQTTEPVLIAEDVNSKSNTLADLASKPDEPLSEIPNLSSDKGGKTGHVFSNDYLEDETGVLAGDAINSQQDMDNSPLPVATPFQVINNTLTEQLDSSNTSSTVRTNDNKNDTLNNITTPCASSLLNNSSANSTKTLIVPENTTGNSRIHNRTLVGEMPPFDNGASDGGSHALFPTSSTALLSSVLVVLTYMMI